MSYLNADLTFDRSQIFADAWRAARSRQNFDRNQHFYYGAPEAQNVRSYFAEALRDIWADARRERAEFQQSTPEQRAAKAELASLLFGAAMIDNTRLSFATQDAIRARFAAAHVS